MHFRQVLAFICRPLCRVKNFHSLGFFYSVRSHGGDRHQMMHVSGRRPMIAKAEAAFQEGIRLEQIGHMPAALTCFRRATELDESDPRYWISLG